MIIDDWSPVERYFEMLAKRNLANSELMEKIVNNKISKETVKIRKPERHRINTEEE